MNRAERIYRLHQLLQGRRPVPLVELMAALETSRATVNRDLQYLRDFFRAPVIYEREQNGYRYDPDAPAFELPGLWFNESELYALLAAEELLEAVQPGLLRRHLGPLKRRIRRLLAASGHRAETISRRIRVHSVAHRRTPSELFATVAQAVLSARVLDMSYHGRARDVATERRVHPQRLVHYRSSWYLLAWCERAQDLRLFALERIGTPTLTDQPARQLPEREVDRDLRASFGIFTGEAREWAVLRFTPGMARWVADEHWHPDQIGQWVDRGYELQVPYSDSTELVMEILRFGPEVEVLAPEALRRTVAERLSAALGQYGTPAPAGSRATKPPGKAITRKGEALQAGPTGTEIRDAASRRR